MRSHPPACPIGRRELQRRQHRTRASIGAQILEQRLDAHLTQAALAAAARIDQAHLSRIERGTASASLDVLHPIAACLGADLGLRLFPGAGPRLRDRFQAPIVDALVRDLHPRWHAAPEAPARQARGVIDLALSLRGGDLGIACECHSEIRALDTVIRRLREKEAALGELDGFGSRTSSVLILRSTEQTRAVARLFEATLAAAFPAKTRDALLALRGTGAWPGPAIIWARLEGGRAEILDHPPRGVRVGR
jgi:transcriptional regulator with XRE-family HTH domain